MGPENRPPSQQDKDLLAAWENTPYPGLGDDGRLTNRPNEAYWRFRTNMSKEGFTDAQGNYITPQSRAAQLEEEGYEVELLPAVNPFTGEEMPNDVSIWARRKNT